MKSLEELQAIRVKMKTQLMNRGVATANDTIITVGMSPSGVAAGAREVMKAVAAAIEANNLKNIKFCQSGDLAYAQQEPIVEVALPGQAKVTYAKVDAAKVNEIFKSHIIGGKPCDKYTLGEGR